MKKHFILVLWSLAFLAGCKSTSIYYWGDYSETLYTFTKEPSAESRIEHKAELLDIINKTEGKKTSTPPGIYFELAMLEAEDGNNNEALTYFEAESKLFPEAKPVVTLAIKELELI